MPKGNNVIPNGHFHKDWQRYVKTWFNQPARKLRRRHAREEKAARIFPRPLKGPLRPVVHSPTPRYNMKVRLGRGFTLDELKEAGVNRYEALSIGIAVDHRRRNKSDKSLKVNVQRLKEYKSKLILFPRRGKKAKGAEVARDTKVEQQMDIVLPIKPRASKLQVIPVEQLDQTQSVYTQLRKARTDARLVGVRAKRVKEKADAAVAAAAKAPK